MHRILSPCISKHAHNLLVTLNRFVFCIDLRSGLDISFVTFPALKPVCAKTITSLKNVSRTASISQYLYRKTSNMESLRYNTNFRPASKASHLNTLYSSQEIKAVGFPHMENTPGTEETGSREGEAEISAETESGWIATRLPIPIRGGSVIYSYSIISSIGHLHPTQFLNFFI